MTQRDWLMALLVVTLLAVLASWKVPTPEPEEPVSFGRATPTAAELADPATGGCYNDRTGQGDTCARGVKRASEGSTCFDDGVQSWCGPIDGSGRLWMGTPETVTRWPQPDFSTWREGNKFVLNERGEWVQRPSKCEARDLNCMD